MEHVQKIAKKIADDYPMPMNEVTESDVRVMLENAAMQMYEKLLHNSDRHARSYVNSVKKENKEPTWDLIETAWIAGCQNVY